MSIQVWWGIPSTIKIIGRDIFTLGATTFDEGFVQQYTKLAAELLVASNINEDSTDDSSSDSEVLESELSELSDSGWESQGTAIFPMIENYSNMPTSHSTSTQMP